MTKNFENKQILLLANSIVFFAALFYSKFLLSLTMWAFILLALTNDDLKIKWSSFKHIFRRYFAQILYWSIGLIFISILVSGINSTDLAEWINHLQLKLPFVVMPLAFASFYFIDLKLKHQIMYFFIGICFLAAFHVLILYLLDYELYNELIGKGQSLPTPIHHVSFSLIISFAVLVSFILFLEDRIYPHLRYAAFIIGFLLFLFIHVLAVRSGLVTMYIALFVLIFGKIISSKNYLKGIGCLAICVVAPVLAYYFVPTFSNKLGYVVWDITQMLENNATNYSDGGRMLSYQLGLDLFKENIILGTGIGDFAMDCESWYQFNVSDYQGKLNFPHNQFLFNLASTGIVGFLLYQSGIWLSFFIGKLYKDPFVLSLFIIVGLSFLVETQLERSVGIAFFLFFMLLGLSQREKVKG